MPIPNNIKKEHLLKAIEKIDIEGIPKDSESQFYDVSYNGKKYPPKVVVSFANYFANGKILDRASFPGGLGTAAFKLLQENGFVITNKDGSLIISFSEELKRFINQAKTEDLTTSSYTSNYLGCKVKIGFGKGNQARIPWIAFLLNNQEVQNGIYPVYLFYKEFNILILAYGVSETQRPILNWNLDNNTQTISEYFHNLGITPKRYGSSYVFSYYDLNKEINWDNVEADLNTIINQYYKTMEPVDVDTAIEKKLSDNYFQNILNEHDFHFSIARLKLEEFDNYKETRTGFTRETLDNFNKKGITFSQYLEKLNQESEEYKLLLLAAQLVSYCDAHAAGKNTYNEYSDKRTIAKSGVYQKNWIQSLLKYKINNNSLDILPSSIKNALIFLKMPQKGLGVLSEKHRELIAKELLTISYVPEKFLDQLKDYFKKFNINPINKDNYNWIIGCLLYSVDELKAIWKKDDSDSTYDTSTNEKFNILKTIEDIKSSGLKYSDNFIIRFVASILTKPFVILTGLSGSGKTKLAQAFVMWICKSEEQYCIVPVGADWTNREPLLGFPNALKESEYIRPDNKVLDLLIAAQDDPDSPYFLILDEMNLSHVERYFSDFLSAMESKNKIPLHSGEKDYDGVPADVGFPKNLFIIGTVNVDETTYMFSPKVLDRANVLEFRVTTGEMKEFIQSNNYIDITRLIGNGSDMEYDFLQTAGDNNIKTDKPELFNEALIRFFAELKKTGAEFGYRSASEILRFAGIANKIAPELTPEDILDTAIMQKLLPKVHGSRRKLEPVLKTLGSLCLNDGEKFDDIISEENPDFNSDARIKYRISFEKIVRMYRNLINNGFTSYAEA